MPLTWKAPAVGLLAGSVVALVCYSSLSSIPTGTTIPVAGQTTVSTPSVSLLPCTPPAVQEGEDCVTHVPATQPPTPTPEAPPMPQQPAPVPVNAPAPDSGRSPSVPTPRTQPDRDRHESADDDHGDRGGDDHDEPSDDD